MAVPTNTTTLEDKGRQKLIGYYLLVGKGTCDLEDACTEAAEELEKEFKDELTPNDIVNITSLTAKYEILRFFSLPKGSSEDSLPEKAIPCYSLLTL